MSWFLHPYQELSYTSLCDVWRQTSVPSGIPGDPGTLTWVPVATNVPCRYVYTQNDSDPTGIGRVKRRSALTEDHVKAPLGVGFQDQDLLVDKSLAADGSHSATYGTVHRAQGEPKLRPDAGFRQLNFEAIQLMSMPANSVPPEVVP